MSRARRSVHGAAVAAPAETGSGFSEGGFSEIADEKSGLHPTKGPRVSGLQAEGGFWNRLIAGLKLTFGVVLVVGVASGVALGAYHYALHSPRFAIDRIEVRGAPRTASPLGSPGR